MTLTTHCIVCGEQGCRCRACDRVRLNRGGHGPMWTPPAHTCGLAANSLTGGSTPNPPEATRSNAPSSPRSDAGE